MVDITIDVWWRFALVVLATWRISHLLTEEDGPADLVVRVRASLGNSVAGSLMDCFYCMTVWVAMPMTALVGRPAAESVLAWLAISGAACLLQQLTTARPRDDQQIPH